MFIGALVALMLYLLLRRMLLFVGRGRHQHAGALAGASIAIFSREVLQSHGVVYWSHSLYQLVMVLTLRYLFQHLTGTPDHPHRRHVRMLAVLAFLGPMTEWTGYLFNLGLIAWFWAWGPRRIVIAAAGRGDRRRDRAGRCRHVRPYSVAVGAKAAEYSLRFESRAQRPQWFVR